jgi:hypothetical protein
MINLDSILTPINNKIVNFVKKYKDYV